MNAGTNVKPQLADSIKAALAARAAKAGGNNADKITFTNADVQVYDAAKTVNVPAGSLVMVVDLNRTALRGQDMAMSKEKVDEKTGEKRGGNTIFISQFIEPLQGVLIPTIAERRNLRVSLMVML